MTAGSSNDVRVAVRAHAPAVIVGVALALFALETLRRGLRFPVPWSDEGSFLWPALAFRDRLHLFAPEVNPVRDAMWMPPGFMVLHGLVFSVLDFSLQRARAVSMVLVASSAFAVMGMTRPLKSRLSHAIAVATVLSFPIIVLVGNTARMESLVMALVTAGFLFMSRGRAAGFALLALAPLVHPNGLFALAGGTVYAAVLLLRLRRSKAQRRDSTEGEAPGTAPLRFRPLDWTLLAATVVAWVAYGFYVASRWHWFKVDMQNQLRFKMMISYGAESDAGARLTEPVIVVGLVALVVGGALAAKYRVPVLGLVCLGASLFVQTVVAAGWLYEIYPAFALLVATIVLVESVQAALGARGNARAPGIALGAGALLAVGLFLAGRGWFLTRSLDRAVVERKDWKPDYLTADDRAVVSARLRALAKDRGRITVQFLPAGEGLVFEDLRGPSLAMVEQTFYVNAFDVLVVHESAWLTPWLHDIQLLRYMMLATPPVPPPETLLVRDGTERFQLYALRPLSPVPPR